jgi:hypothetical protein
MSDYLFEMPPLPIGELTIIEARMMKRAGCDESMMQAASRFENRQRAHVIAFFMDYARRGPRLLALWIRSAESVAAIKRGHFGSEWIRVLTKSKLLSDSSKCKHSESMANNATPAFYASLCRRFCKPEIAQRIQCKATLPDELWRYWTPSLAGGPRHD